jgi:hypothetical protein
MAYALKFPRDVTDIIMSMRDWRYEMVLAGGKTPSARCMPEPLPERQGRGAERHHKPWEICPVDMTPGKLYMQRIDFARYEGQKKVPGAVINIWKGDDSTWPRSWNGREGGFIVQRFPDICKANHWCG